ncbi:unnamed protein product [Cochlearia groenlandica]
MILPTAPLALGGICNQDNSFYYTYFRSQYQIIDPVPAPAPVVGRVASDLPSSSSSVLTEYPKPSTRSDLAPHLFQWRCLPDRRRYLVRSVGSGWFLKCREESKKEMSVCWRRITWWQEVEHRLVGQEGGLP